MAKSLIPSRLMRARATDTVQGDKSNPPRMHLSKSGATTGDMNEESVELGGARNVIAGMNDWKEKPEDEDERVA